MTDSEIYQHIEKVYKTEKGKNFISHLIRSFFPTNKAFIMFGFEEDKKRVMKCCITNEKTFTKDDLFQHVVGQTDEKKDVFMERLMLQASEILDGEKKEASENLKEFEKQTLKIKQNLAIISLQSDKVISQIAYQQLVNFVSSEILRSNGHINWLLKQERAKVVIKDGVDKGFISNKKEEKVVEKAMTSAKLSLSDNEVLKQLKEKMSKQ